MVDEEEAINEALRKAKWWIVTLQKLHFKCSFCTVDCQFTIFFPPDFKLR
jgi:hypothetical protein